jgi:hypothetical protein
MQESLGDIDPQQKVLIKRVLQVEDGNWIVGGVYLFVLL